MRSRLQSLAPGCFGSRLVGSERIQGIIRHPGASRATRVRRNCSENAIGELRIRWPQGLSNGDTDFIVY